MNSVVGVPRPPRSKQLWIHGPGGCGKSSFVFQMARAYRLNLYLFPKEETFHDLFLNDTYSLAVADEFAHQVTVQQLNSFCDGHPTLLKTKGGAAIRKTQNIPLVVISNFHPSECYANLYNSGSASYAALLSRFTVVSIPSSTFVNFDFLEALENPYSLVEQPLYHSYGLLDDTYSPILFLPPPLVPPSPDLPSMASSPSSPQFDFSQTFQETLSPVDEHLPLSPSQLSDDFLHLSASPELVSPSDPFFDTPCPVCHFLHPSWVDCRSSSPPRPTSLEVLRSHYSDPSRKRCDLSSPPSVKVNKRARYSSSLSSLFDTSASVSRPLFDSQSDDEVFSSPSASDCGDY